MSETDPAYDYIIVGSGAAGCVLAYRLSEDPSVKVALLEAGEKDSNPLLQVPKAVALVMQTPQLIWVYPTEAEPGTGDKVETWVRGRVLGGSTSINGLMYVRGQPADFDSIAEQTSDDWSWKHIGAAYAALENHELGAGEARGGSGPLHVTLPGPDIRNPLHEAMIAAGAEMGLPVKTDVNAPDNGEGIGYNPRTVYRGRRESAAVAFLKPIRHRANLTVITGAVVDKVLFDGLRATGVEFIRKGRRERLNTRREVILAGGAMASPGILERSGVGDPALLASLGVKLVHANPAVGEHMLEHRALLMQWKLNREGLSYNHLYKGWRLVLSALGYLLTRKGPISSATFDIGAWLKSRPGLNRPDVQFLIAPHSIDFQRMGKTTEPFPGMSLVVYPLRPSSAGSVHIRSTDPEQAPKVSPNHRATQEDRVELVNAVKAARRYASQPTLSRVIEAETVPGPAYQTDEEILKAYDTFATCGYHAVGSCRMGSDAASVVDPELRVRGVSGLRVMDTSIMPVVPSGNTNGPTMAMAWRAADIIKRAAST